jgi:acyl carrier protein
MSAGAAGEVSARVDDIFRHALQVDVPGFRADLIESAVLDSLAFLILISELEHKFEVEIPLDGLDIESFRTVERIVRFIQGLKGQMRAPAQSAAGP